MKRRSFLAGLAMLPTGAAVTGCADYWNKPMTAEDRAWWDRYERRAEARRLVREVMADARRERRRWRR